MCLAIPSKVIELDDMLATVDLYGARTSVSLMLMPEEVRVGDYVLVHAGFALQRLDEAAALDSLALLREVQEFIEAEEAEARASGLLCGPVHEGPKLNYL